MDFSVALENINWVAVLAAWVTAMVWGYVWYSKKAMGNQWMKAAGLNDKDIQKAGSMPMLAMMVLTLVSAIVLAALLSDLEGWFDGLFDGAIIGTALVATNQTMIYLFEQRSSDLIKIDGIYVICNFALMGLVLSLF